MLIVIVLVKRQCDVAARLFWNDSKDNLFTVFAAAVKFGMGKVNKKPRLKENSLEAAAAAAYESLLGDISKLYEEKVGMGLRQRNEQLVISYWEIGDRIVRGERDEGITRRYGKKLVPRLSEDLTARFGAGFGQTNIFTIRRFRLEYERAKLHPSLTWSHYKTLLSIRDDSRRRAMEERVIEEQLPDTRLKVLARLANGMSAAEESEGLLNPRSGRLYLYKVVSEERNGRKTHLLDCGFQVKRRIPFNGVKHLRDGEILRCTKTGDFNYCFERGDFESSERYCYNANVLDVVDGDTLKLRVDLGFDSFIDERFRLRGVDAPELETTEGKKAARFVRLKLKSGSSVLLFTYGCDMYGRYLADVFYSTSKKAKHPTVSSGCFLNEELLEKKLAGYWGVMRWK